MNLWLAPPEDRNNKSIFLDAVKQHGCALNFSSDTLKADYEIVMAAVKHSCKVLRYSLDSLNANYEIVLAAVKQNGNAL